MRWVNRAADLTIELMFYIILTLTGSGEGVNLAVMGKKRAKKQKLEMWIWYVKIG